MQVGSPDRIPFVSTGKIDYVMGAMTRNPTRALIIDYTLPVHTEIFGVLTVEGKPFNTWQELNSSEVTIGAGTRHHTSEVHRRRTCPMRTFCCSTTTRTSFAPWRRAAATRCSTWWTSSAST